jgi:hypothetical protein
MKTLLTFLILPLLLQKPFFINSSRSRFCLLEFLFPPALFTLTLFLSEVLLATQGTVMDSWKLATERAIVGMVCLVLRLSWRRLGERTQRLTPVWVGWQALTWLLLRLLLT